MGRVRTMVRGGLAGLALLSSGCGQDPFGAPARSGPSLASATEEPRGARAIYMVTPSAPAGEVEVWGILAQREANLRKAIFRVMGPVPGQPSANQADIVRSAVADGASALIVLPGDSPDLARALVDAEAKGVPVILLGRSIPAPEGSKPFTYVDHEPFEPLAKRIMATTLDDVKKAGRPLSGAVLLVSDRVTDRNSAARLAALKGAVEGAGLRSIVDVGFDGATAGSAKASVLEAIKAHPDVIMALADEGEGITGASQARTSLGGTPTFFVGGFAGYRSTLNAILFQKESCFVEGRVDELARLAVVTALKKLDGEAIEGRVELGSTFNRGEGDLATPAQGKSDVSAETFNKGLDAMMPRPSARGLPKPER